MKKIYERKRPAICASLSQESSQFIETISQILTINKSKVLDYTIAMLQDKYTIEDIINYMYTVKK